MNLSTLCAKIELQPSVKRRVLAFAESFDFQTIHALQQGYLIYENMREALTRTRAALGDDPDGIKILSCMLQASVDAYEIYQKKGIPDEIYVATMGCFTRFIDETYKMTGKLCFDRSWWTTRQAGCHLFRIGALEYEIKPIDTDVVIDMHIPSDADFSPQAVEKSLQDASRFFAEYAPSLQDAEYRCHSWLLDGQLREMLGETSNILSFQNRFEILDEGESDTEFLEWLFQTKAAEYHALPERTSLQRNVKLHLLAGGVIRSAYGRIKP